MDDDTLAATLKRIEAKLDYLLDCLQQPEEDSDEGPYGREREDGETL